MSNPTDSLALFARTGDGVWAVDANCRIVLWNRAAEELLGYTADQALGQRCHDLLRGRDLEGKPFCAERCSATVRVEQRQDVDAFDVQVRSASGRVRAINVSVIAVPEEAGGHTLVHLFRPLGEEGGRPLGLRIRLLGPVAVERTDGPQVGGPLWRRAKVRGLLSYLALRQGRPVRREELLETLWPDLERDAVLHNLNTTVYGLRHSLELGRGADSGYIHYEGDCYLLSADHVHWLDMDAFEAGIARARRQSQPDLAQTLYREALALYRGDFLADLDPDLVGAWAERERLRQLYLNAMEELGALCEGQDQEGAAAVPLYRGQPADRHRS